MQIVKMTPLAEPNALQEQLSAGKERGDIVDWMFHPKHGLLLEGQTAQDAYCWARWFLSNQGDMVEIVNVEELQQA